jgi:hypothetical protein
MGREERSLGARCAVACSRHLKRDPDGAGVLDESARDLLPHPKARVRSEAMASLRIELVAGAHQSNRSLLYEIGGVNRRAPEAPRNADRHVEVGCDQRRFAPIRLCACARSDGRGRVVGRNGTANPIENPAVKAKSHELFFEDGTAPRLIEPRRSGGNLTKGRDHRDASS